MKTIISNKIWVEDATPELYWWCRDNLVVKNPTYETLMRLGKQDQIARSHIQKEMSLYVENGLDLIIPFGCLYAIWNFIKDSPYELRFNENKMVINPNLKITQPLYDYQEEAVNRMIAAKGGVLIGGCGSGKTNCGIEIIKRVGVNALWLCHTKDLLKQTVARIHKLYPTIPVGTITDGKIDMVKNGITVSTIQTLVNIDTDYYAKNFGLVMTDECHHVVSSPTIMKMFGKVISKIPARYKYGLTASEQRNDSMTKSIFATIGCDINGELQPVWKIDRKDTNTLTAKHVKVELDTPFDYCMLNDDGTFNYANLIDYISKNEKRNDTICDNVVRMSKEQRKQLVLCSRIEQCETIHNKLLERGLKSVLLVGKVSDKKRTEILEEKIEWEVIVATLSLAKEGLDVPILSTLHLASCVGNKSDTVQSVGRIERVCDNKPEPIAYDYVDMNIPYLTSRYKKRVGWLKNR